MVISEKIFVSNTFVSEGKFKSSARSTKRKTECKMKSRKRRKTETM